MIKEFLWPGQFDRAYLSRASTLLVIFMIFHTLSAGRRAEANPWGEGAMLEWVLSSPPPFHISDDLPVVS
ncbi:MAG: hypothetical protein ACREE2_18400 [Stellaceae bacterium]